MRSEQDISVFPRTYFMNYRVFLISNTLGAHFGSFMQDMSAAIRWRSNEVKLTLPDRCQDMLPSRQYTKLALWWIGAKVMLCDHRIRQVRPVADGGHEFTKHNTYRACMLRGQRACMLGLRGLGRLGRWWNPSKCTLRGICNIWNWYEKREVTWIRWTYLAWQWGTHET